MVVISDRNKLIKRLYTDESVTSPDATTHKMKSLAVGFKGGKASPVVLTTWSAADNVAGTEIGVSCRPTSFALVDLLNFDYSNANPTVTATTTQFIDDPDRVSPKIDSCVDWNSSKDAISIYSNVTTTNTAPMCEYYFNVYKSAD